MQCKIIDINFTHVFFLVMCEDPGTPVNGVRSLTNGLMEDSVVTYGCNFGYQLSGTRMQTCELSVTEGPVWQNGSLPSCTCKITDFIYVVMHYNVFTVDTCGDPGQPDNGNTIGSSFSIGEAVDHTCDEGFVLVGAMRRVCQPDGQWSDPLPSCVGKCN